MSLKRTILCFCLHYTAKCLKHACSRVGLAVRGGNTKCTDTGCLGTVYRYGSKCTGIPEPTQGAELSLSRTHMHARAHTHTRARTHTHYAHTSPLPPPPPPPPSDVCFSLLLPTRHLVFLPSLSLCLSLLPICPWQRNKEPSKPGIEVKLLTVAIDIRRERESKSLQHCVLWYTSAKYWFWGEIPVKILVRLSIPVPSPTHVAMEQNMKHRQTTGCKECS